MSMSLYKVAPLCRNLLLIDGLSRSGKVFACKLISNIRNVEYFQYPPIVEHIPILWHAGLLDTASATAYLQLSVNFTNYDRAIGRNLNTRLGDGTCVFNATDYGDLLRRTLDGGGEEAVERFNAAGRIPAFMTHEVLPHIALFFDLAPNVTVVEMARHPLDVALSWINKGMGTRLGTDPLAFPPVLSMDGRPLPWFARTWAEAYMALSPTDRILRGILELLDMGTQARARLPAHHQARIMDIAYERVCLDPVAEIAAVAAFLGSEPFDNIAAVAARETVPPNFSAERRQAKMARLRQDASPGLFDRFMAAGAAYEARWPL